MFKKEIIVRKSIDKISNIITEIENYPKFLPFCNKIDVIEKNEESINAKMTISFCGIKYSFLSITEISRKKNYCTILTTNKDDIYIKLLNSEWILEEIDSNQTKINYQVEIILKNKIQTIVMNNVFNKVAKNIVDSFIQRLVSCLD